MAGLTPTSYGVKISGGGCGGTPFVVVQHFPLSETLRAAAHAGAALHSTWRQIHQRRLQNVAQRSTESSSCALPLSAVTWHSPVWCFGVAQARCACWGGRVRRARRRSRASLTPTQSRSAGTARRWGLQQLRDTACAVPICVSARCCCYQHSLRMRAPGCRWLAYPADAHWLQAPLDSVCAEFCH